MTTLGEALNLVLTLLQGSPWCDNVRVVETHQFSDRQFALKIRADLARGGVLQVRLYHNQGHVDYAYQLFHGDQPLLRWDNKEHFLILPRNLIISTLPLAPSRTLISMAIPPMTCRWYSTI